jgi:hypothetical protein
MSVNPSKNDAAWQILFQEENILERIERDGYCDISSETINKKRESRLMTKFDHRSQLPMLFREHNLSIQPVSRGNYIIGNFSSYFSLPEDKVLPETQYFELPPHIETIASQNIGSESSAILCAYLSGMLTNILEEETFFTVFGRMSTGQFDYEIYNLLTPSNPPSISH